MSQSLFRKEALDHQRERLWGEVVLTQSVSTRFLTLGLGFILAGIIAFLIFGTYTRKETVPGYLVPEGGLVQVHAAQPGTVSKINVRSGDMVSQGDVLMEVETDKSMMDGNTLSTMMVDLLDQQKLQLKQRIERHELRREDRRAYLETMIEGRRDQVRQLGRQSELQQERMALMETRYQALESLREDQLISEEEYQSRYQAYLDARQEYERMRQALVAEQARLNEAVYELESLNSNTQESIDQLEAEIAALDQRMVQQQGNQAFTIRAPAAGQVTSLQASVGNRAHPDRPLLAILPEDSRLEAELLIPTEAIGFIKTELAVKVRYHAFPYERFGVHESRVTDVARTILTPQEIDAPVRVDRPVYRVKASLTEQAMNAYGQSMPLQAGMTLDADIQLDERPLYQWILRPLYSLEGTL